MDVVNLPDDPAALKAIITTLARQRDEAARQRDEAELRALRLAHQLEQLKKRYYGPRADRLEVGQLLLEFACALESRPVNPDDLPPGTPPEQSVSPAVRRVKRGRRNVGDFDKLPVIQSVHDLGEGQKPCPCCGKERQKIEPEKGRSRKRGEVHYRSRRCRSPGRARSRMATRMATSRRSSTPSISR